MKALGALVGLLALAGTAQAQIGPDVITWRIGQYISGGESISNYPPANGKEAYSFCTVSCNIGDEVLLWESGGSPRHPTIGQSLFRLKNGRFEHLGQGFMKHGFCALSEPGCGNCQATPCSTLGIGCADTYGAGLNDGAGGGRKSQVNACRGDHIHPFSGPTGTDPNAGRLVAYTSEVNQGVNGNDQAEYFIEGQYVAEDDQLAGNVANNASWRKVSVDSANDLHIIPGHPTIVEPAIFAWPAADPLVILNEVSNVDEGGPGIHGLFYAAGRATDNGDGTWDYSYAVQNLSSDDAGYSFAVPAVSSLSVTGTWFTAVEWHSGEPYNNLPWGFSHSGGKAKWTCAETALQNADANALRWGTMYSFGFTADAAPSPGSAELTLFTTGGVLTTSLPHPDPGAVVGCPGDDLLEDNDDCASAWSIGTSPINGLQVHGTGSAVDWDYFSVTLGPQDQLDVDIFFSHAGGDIDLYLYSATAPTCGDSTNFLVRGYSASDDEVITYTNTSGGSQDYVVGVETWGGVVCNTYDIDVDITPYVPPSPCTQPDDAYEENDSCVAATQMVSGIYDNLWLDDFEDDWFLTEVAPGESIDVTIYFSDAEADVDMAIYDACGGNYLDGGASVSNNEYCNWTNSSGSTRNVMTRVYMYSPDNLDCVFYDLEISVDNETFGDPFCFGDGSDGGACPCGGATPGSGEGCPNVTGLGAYLTASGTASVSSDTLLLTVLQAAPSDFGIFVQNIQPRAVPMAFYNGLLCLAVDAHLVRHYAPPTVLPTITDVSGSGTNQQGMTVGDFQNDTQPGVTVFYQFWGRDNGNPCGNGANFSSGRAITWVP